MVCLHMFQVSSPFLTVSAVICIMLNVCCQCMPVTLFTQLLEMVRISVFLYCIISTKTTKYSDKYCLLYFYTLSVSIFCAYELFVVTLHCY